MDFATHSFRVATSRNLSHDFPGLTRVVSLIRVVSPVKSFRHFLLIDKGLYKGADLSLSSG